jgi:hypothetical protein
MFSSSRTAYSCRYSFTSVLAFWNLFRPFLGSSFYDFSKYVKALVNYLLAARVMPMNEYRTGFLELMPIALSKLSAALSYFSCL